MTKTIFCESKDKKILHYKIHPFQILIKMKKVKTNLIRTNSTTWKPGVGTGARNSNFSKFYTSHFSP